jgi:hypothetical protein
MSYSPRQAVDERQAEVWTATKEEDAERLYQLAAQFKEEGEDELADELHKIARRIERDEWAYDEARDNEL